MDPATATIVAGVIIAVFAAIPGILAGIATLRAANNAAAIALRAVQVSEETLVQSKEIHVAVNSNLAALKQELADSNKHIAELKNTIATLLASAVKADTASVSARLDSLEKR